MNQIKFSKTLLLSGAALCLTAGMVSTASAKTLTLSVDLVAPPAALTLGAVTSPTDLYAGLVKKSTGYINATGISTDATDTYKIALSGYNTAAVTTATGDSIGIELIDSAKAGSVVISQLAFPQTMISATGCTLGADSKDITFTTAKSEATCDIIASQATMNSIQTTKNQLITYTFSSDKGALAADYTANMDYTITKVPAAS